MNQIRAFFYFLTGAMASFGAATASEIAAHSYEEMAQFLEKFPEFNECSLEQQEEAFAFIKKQRKCKSSLQR